MTRTIVTFSTVLLAGWYKPVSQQATASFCCKFWKFALPAGYAISEQGAATKKGLCPKKTCSEQRRSRSRQRWPGNGQFGPTLLHSRRLLDTSYWPLSTTLQGHWPVLARFPNPLFFVRRETCVGTPCLNVLASSVRNGSRFQVGSNIDH